MTAKAPTPPTAAAAYADGQQRIRKALAELTAALKVHKARAGKCAGHWGFAGDLGRVLSLIEEATQGVK